MIGVSHTNNFVQHNRYSDYCQRCMYQMLEIDLKLEKLVSASSNQCGKVWLTVSSLWRPIATNNKVVDAELEVNWEIDCPEDVGYADSIKVFTADPAHSNY